ncbi:MAG: hypothetical protein H6Q30_536 [Bacteroidetes bacterium]|nr:hypothetical protein [Bacteroidota bacterium]
MSIDESNQRIPEIMTSGAIRAMLGIEKTVPLSPDAMAQSLRVTFFPGGKMTPRLVAFTEKLRNALLLSNVEVLPYEQALSDRRRSKVKEGIVIIAPGDLETGNLPVDHLPNLRTNTVVGIVEGPCPAETIEGEQSRLNSIVEMLAWNIFQVAIYVEEHTWTICTMNGAIIHCPDPSAFQSDVFSTLVPKLAAPVVPPHASDFDMHEGSLDLYSNRYRPYVDDFEMAAPLWAETGLMLFHTSLESLAFRSTYYKRVAAAYLDRRSGMSYGFLSRQIAVPVMKAQEIHARDRIAGLAELEEKGFVRVEGRLHVLLHLGSRRYVLDVPPVHVLATRSGCDKAHIKGHRDLMLLGLTSGAISVQTPPASDGIDFRPSYDTLTILAHALGNALIASLMVGMDDPSPFSPILTRNGMALAHWHGDVNREIFPDGITVFGEENPPVSCSTHQAAMYTLRGKLEGFSRQIARQKSYLGDIHIEPHHGVNVTWPSLLGLAKRLLARDGRPDQYEMPEVLTGTTFPPESR